MNNTTRQPGCYRVKWNTEKAKIMMWSGSHWWAHGINTWVSEDDVTVLDPTPIDPNPATQPDINQLMDVLQSVQYYFASPNGIGARDHAIRTSKKVDAVLELFRETPQPTHRYRNGGIPGG